MKKEYYFKKREDVLNFLEKYDFKYYIPRLDQETSPKRSKYYIVVNDDKLLYGSVVSYFTKEMKDVYMHHTFYDKNQEYFGYFLDKEVGERYYRETKEEKNDKSTLLY